MISSYAAQYVYVMIAVVLTLLLSLYLFTLFTKINTARKKATQKKHEQSITPVLQRVLQPTEPIDENARQQDYQALDWKNKGRSFYEVIERLLLAALSHPETEEEKRARALDLAYQLELPAQCLSLIKNRDAEKVALGCYKAGLYKYEQALPSMLDALKLLSSNCQMQIIQAISSIGDVAAMEEAFDRIQGAVLINQRSLAEAMDSFAGDKYQLYRRMFQHSSEYVMITFMKSIDAETAKMLIPEILSIAQTGDKEIRIAAIKALTKAGDQEQIPYLLKALSDPDWEIRAIAAKALGQLTPPEASEHLLKAVCDAEWWVRQNAATALLSYPNFESLLTAALKTGDSFARDSLLHAVKKKGDNKLLLLLNPESSN